MYPPPPTYPGKQGEQKAEVQEVLHGGNIPKKSRLELWVIATFSLGNVHPLPENIKLELG